MIQPRNAGNKSYQSLFVLAARMHMVTLVYSSTIKGSISGYCLLSVVDPCRTKEIRYTWAKITAVSSRHLPPPPFLGTCSPTPMRDCPSSPIAQHVAGNGEMQQTPKLPVAEGRHTPQSAVTSTVVQCLHFPIHYKATAAAPASPCPLDACPLCACPLCACLPAGCLPAECLPCSLCSAVEWLYRS
jgi:hypothetical protein